jgi:hypothetical protein
MGSKLYYCGRIVKTVKRQDLPAFCRIKRLFAFFILSKTHLIILLTGHFRTCRNSKQCKVLQNIKYYLTSQKCNAALGGGM